MRKRVPTFGWEVPAYALLTEVYLDRAWLYGERPVPVQWTHTIQRFGSEVELSSMGAYEVGILRQFPFTSSLQRMSVITRSLYGSEFCVYAKGAPEMIETLCRRDTIPSDFQSVLLKYARDGYRVLALAWRPLKVSCVRALRIERERAEQNLLFLGYLIMENRLKKESNSVIQTLKDANIRPVMVTAISVARDCEFIDEWDRIIIVSAKPPPHVATSDGTKVDSPAHPYAPQVNAHLGTELDDVAPLVEFHYAEDLHKPVTEVTATHDLNSVLHTQRTRQSRQTVPQTSVKKTRFFDRWWPLGTKRRYRSVKSGCCLFV
ncbi:hypothetical protein X801_02902 [Opisthorchis viverrini]|uniref:Uncharacterized protein n=1 Tax=Opisthorchis viverrini TaxID=6198 RepID=A0A1S8X3B8_OPIVI|nr:hypothetical protein X801_02902 [Opisthorchis viverrini]